MTRSASTRVMGPRGVSRTSAETAALRQLTKDDFERARCERATLHAVQSLQEVRLDNSRALEVLELQRISRHLQSGIEWQQADELAAQHLHARVARATFDLAPASSATGHYKITIDPWTTASGTLNISVSGS